MHDEIKQCFFWLIIGWFISFCQILVRTEESELAREAPHMDVREGE